MAINKSEQSLEDKLLNDVNELKNQLLYLKTHPQPIGADGIKYAVANGGTSITVASGATSTISFKFTPSSDFVLNGYDYLLTIIIDTYDTAHLYAGGASLTAGQRNLDLEHWMDFQNSDFVSPFGRIFNVHIKNNDSASHVYYVNIGLVYPTLVIA